MNEHLELLDTVLDYMNEHGKMGDFYEWCKMYDIDVDDLEHRIDNRYQNV